MANQQTDEGSRPPATSGTGRGGAGRDGVPALIAAGGVGRIGYTSRFGPVVLPVNYDLYEGTIVFRTGLHSSMVEDLHTGIADAEYKVAFEIDEIQPVTQEGWSVLVQGSAHFVESEAELAPIARAGRAGMGERPQGAVHPHHPHSRHRPAHPEGLQSQWHDRGRRSQCRGVAGGPKSRASGTSVRSPVLSGQSLGPAGSPGEALMTVASREASMRDSSMAKDVAVMRARVGDMLVVPGSHTRTGLIVRVVGQNGAPPYVVKWLATVISRW